MTLNRPLRATALWDGTTHCNVISGCNCIVSIYTTLRASKETVARNLRLFNPLAYTDVPETAGLARSINP